MIYYHFYNEFIINSLIYFNAKDYRINLVISAGVFIRNKFFGFLTLEPIVRD